jgi:hypothetical protein
VLNASVDNHTPLRAAFAAALALPDFEPGLLPAFLPVACVRIRLTKHCDTGNSSQFIPVAFSALGAICED